MLSRKSKRAIIGFVFAAGLVIVILMASSRYFGALEEKRRYLEEKASLEPRPPQVHVVKRETRTLTRTLSATLEPWRRVFLAAEVSGRITWVHVEIGDSVVEGQPLVEIDSAVAVAALAAAEARVSENRRLLAESQTLASRNVAAKTDLEASAARLAISEAELAQAQETLALHTICAPFAGRVAAKLAEGGDQARPGVPLIELVDTTKLRVVFHVPEQEVKAFQPGGRVSVRPSLMEARPLDAKVQFIAAAADQATRLFRIEAVIEPAPPDLVAGQQAVVSADVTTLNDALFVPAAAVRIAGGKALVRKIDSADSSRSNTIAITVGSEIDGDYVVLDGLSENDAILIQ